MTRFVGIKDNHVKIVSDKQFSCNDLQIIELSSQFDHVPAMDLITQYRVKNGQLFSKLQQKDAQDMKVALVGNYAMACGIATYGYNLFPEIAKHIKDVKLFIEKNERPTHNIYQFGEKTLPEDKVISCWERGKSLKELIDALKEYDPDVIIINHEFGLWSNAAYWMSMMTQLSDYRVLVIMHSVFPHHKDKTIVEACIPEIIVHLEDAKQVLSQTKGISNPIHVIPHGCYYGSNKRLWNFYKTPHTIIQMGFGFRYKAFEDTIIACSLLKEKYPDIFLTIIFSEAIQSKNEHQLYYNELLKLINSLSLQENVAIVRGFQSDEVINSYLHTNRVAVFPYKSDPEHLVYGASGAARLAMAANIPVVSSLIPHFSDLPTIKCQLPEDIAQELDKLFSNSKYYKDQIEKQNNFIEENSWEKVALKFIKLLENNY